MDLIFLDKRVLEMNKKCLEYPNKKRHSTKKDAETSLLLIDNKNLTIYFCESCEGWHLAKIVVD